MGPVADKTAWPILDVMAAALCEEIKKSGLPEPCFCEVFPGSEVSLAYCDTCGDKCGMAWTRLVNLRPAGSDLDLPPGCAAPLTMQIEMGVSRCAATLDDDGTPPPAEILRAETQLQMADMSAMRRAICKALRGERWAMAGYSPMGPQGGCVGGAWSVFVEE